MKIEDRTRDKRPIFKVNGKTKKSPKALIHSFVSSLA